MRLLKLVLFACLALSSIPAAAQALINGQPPALFNNVTWIAQQDVTLDASGNATWTYDPANPPPVIPAVVHLPRAMDATNPIICNYMTRTLTAVTVHCWRTNISGLLSGLLGGSIAGAQVTLVARAIP